MKTDERRSESIRRVGLKKYLDTTSHLHRDRTYEDLANMIRYRTTNAEIGRSFGVSTVTVYKWRTIFEEERNGRV